MKNLPAAVLCVFFVGISLVLQACALITSPITTTVLGGAQLAIKGTELTCPPKTDPGDELE